MNTKAASSPIVKITRRAGSSPSLALLCLGGGMSFSFTQRAFPDLPEEVAAVLTSSLYTEYATMTPKGVPLDTPLFAFMGPDGGTIDVATGLAYPAKANRARRNPKVGLLLEGNGNPGEPVVSIAGFGAVRDADIQGNLERYLAETAARLPVTSGGLPWSTVRQAVWYWARIIVQTTPWRVAWWPSTADLDSSPTVWTAPDTKVFPESDPAPSGPPTAPATWHQPTDWRPRAREVLERGLTAHLTVGDAEGFPLPFRVRSIEQVDKGFTLDVPKGAPWAATGRASLCFSGRGTFVGVLETNSDGALLSVERRLPDLPLMANPAELWEPQPETKASLLARLEKELARRGLPLPTVPAEPPPPTAGSLLRTNATTQNHRPTVPLDHT
jgi:hypothetical protein